MRGDTSLAALSARYGPRYRWILLLSVMVGTMASVMSSTIVNVAIPDLSRHFSLTQERAQWVSSGFMVAMTVSMLTTPWLLSRFGYRRTYVSTMLLLMAGGIGGGLASHYGLVLAARVLEGLAAGVVQPIPVIIMMRAFEPHEQGRASGLFGMGVVLAPALGPSIGGLLVDWWGWRSIFFMVVPFCLGSIWLAYRYVPTTGPGGAAAQSGFHLDWRGLLLGSLGTLTLLNGLLELRGGEPLLAGGLLLASVLAFAATLAWLRRAPALGREPLVNLRLFHSRSYAAGSLVAFIYGIALFGSTYLLPVFMQLGLALPASHVGTILLPAGIVLAFTMGGAGRISHRLPNYLMVGGGLALLTVSFALTATVGLQGSLALLVAWTIVGRVGLGFIMPSLNVGAMRSLDRQLIPQGASAINFVRQLGGAMGVSLCAVVLEWRIAAHGDSLANTATSAARVAAFHEVFLLLAVVCGLAVVAAWQLREPQAAPPAQ
ncbi:MAG TPA: MFS transporter [Ramlibacter sp.]|nr:MFS transporter [Ramlibacter sp.]